MTSEPREAFVWIWLPGAEGPVVAGRLDRVGELISFTYGRSYLEREERIPLYLPELPLRRGQIMPVVGTVAGCIADAGPDAWGQRVILNHRIGSGAADTAELSQLTYLLESGSDRIGALDFQASSTDYAPRSHGEARLSELSKLAEAARKVEEGVPLSPALDQALLHGSSIGGARPKVLLEDGARRLIAKFSSTTDTFPVVKGEFVAMELARRVGIDAAKVELTEALGKDVLLVERFDRPASGGRRALVSALTILGLDEWGGRYASYEALADEVRARFTEPKATLRELFSRLTFNVLAGNTDDHARNHAAFWDGAALTLTPAYDVCPLPRAGGEASQAMAIGRDGFRLSQVAACVSRAPTYLLTEEEAGAIVDRQIETIEEEWDEACDLARLSEVDRRRLRGGAFLNPFSIS
ncbi:MAG TPA: HipA domain-containing protein [Solirubrobacterales bacterium]|nr:HipA domain-containing protein [Solirubrobacterales bacterium]